MRRAYLAMLVLLTAGYVIAGCAVMKKFATDMKNANAPQYMWDREKVFQYTVDGQVVPFEQDSALKAPPPDHEGEPAVTYMDTTLTFEPTSITTRVYVVYAGETKALLPVDVAEAVPKEYAEHLDSLIDIQARYPGPEHFVVLKSTNGDWNREVFYTLNEQTTITLNEEGPKTIMIISMLSINRDEALDNTRKYIYTIEDENGNVTEVPAYATRRNDVLFYGVESESASTPFIFAFKVPEGGHVYKVRFKYSDGGNILLKFCEAKYR